MGLIPLSVTISEPRRPAPCLLFYWSNLPSSSPPPPLAPLGITYLENEKEKKEND